MAGHRTGRRPGTSHWVAEEALQEMLTALATFPAQYRDQARSTQPRATAMPGK